MKLPSVATMNVKGKRVLVRAGFDVPIDASGRVRDAFRLTESLPTLRWLIKQKASVVLLAHRGRPNGRRQARFSLAPVARALRQLLGREVEFFAGRPKDAARRIYGLTPGSVALLENLRFDLREESFSAAFARELAVLGQCFVNDDFSTSHRRHTSMALLPRLLPHAAGLTLLREVAMLERLRTRPVSPFLVVLGGAKVGDKLGALLALLPRVDDVLVGGAAATTLLAAKGVDVGTSLVDRSLRPADALRLSRSKKIHLPVDVVVARFAASRKAKTAPVGDISHGQAAFDLGPATCRAFGKLLATARTVFWVGPVGVTENQVFQAGTKALARRIPARAFSVAGGGDTANALHATGYDRRFTFLSTGGGATLAFLGGKILPGIDALRR